MCVTCRFICFFFFFKQKTAYEMRISDWSSDVCSSDLPVPRELLCAVSVRHRAWIVDGNRTDGFLACSPAISCRSWSILGVGSGASGWVGEYLGRALRPLGRRAGALRLEIHRLPATTCGPVLWPDDDQATSWHLDSARAPDPASLDGDRLCCRDIAGAGCSIGSLFRR